MSHDGGDLLDELDDCLLPVAFEWIRPIQSIVSLQVPFQVVPTGPQSFQFRDKVTNMFGPALGLEYILQFSFVTPEVGQVGAYASSSIEELCTAGG